jgi:hypothetical protein
MKKRRKTAAELEDSIRVDSSESRALFEYAEMQKRYRSVLTDRAPTILKKPPI